ncbi:MAG: endonuclease III, partial [Candidatus Thermoplasmatota archaeon]|nr:endonuclease III [Candidatus Thermoplasmatota archaeon]
QFSHKDFQEPFKNLVIGILSQNTNDRNSTRAYVGLLRKFNQISPQILAEASEFEIKEAIKQGGLYNIKAKRLKQLAKTILEKFGDDLTPVLSLSESEQRKELLKLPGIGNKTADVFLAYCGKHATLPIDTNIARVIKRLGIGSERMGYEELQKAVQSSVPVSDRVRAHELLLRLGRDFCKAKSPLCEACPVRKLCKD